MKSPTSTTIVISKDDMSCFWGENDCLPSDIVIIREDKDAELSPDTVDYSGYVTFTFDRSNNLHSIHIDLAGIVEEPTIDPNEPIPYEVTNKGKGWVQGFRETIKNASGVPYNSEKR